MSFSNHPGYVDTSKDDWIDRHAGYLRQRLASIKLKQKIGAHPKHPATTISEDSDDEPYEKLSASTSLGLKTTSSHYPTPSPTFEERKVRSTSPQTKFNKEVADRLMRIQAPPVITISDDEDNAPPGLPPSFLTPSTTTPSPDSAIAQNNSRSSTSSVRVTRRASRAQKTRNREEEIITNAPALPMLRNGHYAKLEKDRDERVIDPFAADRGRSKATWTDTEEGYFVSQCLAYRKDEEPNFTEIVAKLPGKTVADAIQFYTTNYSYVRRTSRADPCEY